MLTGTSISVVRLEIKFLSLNTDELYDFLNISPHFTIRVTNVKIREIIFIIIIIIFIFIIVIVIKVNSSPYANLTTSC